MILRKTLTAILAALCVTATLAPGGALAQQSATILLPPQDLALVYKAQAYLRGLGAVQGRFEQTNARGVVQTGDLFLDRPGKARFQYDPPSGLTVVSDGHSVAQWDPRLRTFDRAPLAATPLAIFLARRLRLDEDVDVTRVGPCEDGFYLSIRRISGEARNEGYITLVFGGSPLTLRGWTLVDGQGQATKVRILNLAPLSVKPELFVLDDPRTPEEKGRGGRKGKPAAPADFVPVQ
jgi:outer membrane lipoprotein-sorting protein